MSFKRKAPDTNGTAEKKARSITSFFGTPAGGSNGQASKSIIKFNKKEWVDSLNAEQKDLLQLEINTLDDSWLSVLKDTLTERYFLDLKRFLKGEVAAGRTFYPPQDEIYSWSRHTPLNSVKILILGQDPYHNTNQAHGLSFSVKPPTKAPPSLKNMFIALKKDYPSFVPPANGEGLLLPWADRGVLMLNACLTVKAHTANSHAGKGWEILTQKVIDVVAAKRTHGVVFMSWGSPAAKRVAKVDRAKHLVLQAVHPSPLSAHKGFFDCQHFKKANEWLVTRYGPNGGVDWNSIGKGPALVSANDDEAPGPSKILPMSSVKSKIMAKTLKPVVNEPIVDDLADDEEAMREMEAAESSAPGPSPAKLNKPSMTSEGTLDEFEDADGPIDWTEAENVMEAKEKHAYSEDAPTVDK